jgi:hypothetical protein
VSIVRGFDTALGAVDESMANDPPVVHGASGVEADHHIHDADLVLGIGNVSFIQHELFWCATLLAHRLSSSHTPAFLLGYPVSEGLTDNPLPFVL